MTPGSPSVMLDRPDANPPPLPEGEVRRVGSRKWQELILCGRSEAEFTANAYLEDAYGFIEPSYLVIADIHTKLVLGAK